MKAPLKSLPFKRKIGKSIYEQTGDAGIKDVELNSIDARNYLVGEIFGKKRIVVAESGERDRAGYEVECRPRRTRPPASAYGPVIAWTLIIDLTPSLNLPATASSPTEVRLNAAYCTFSDKPTPNYGCVLDGMLKKSLLSCSLFSSQSCSGVKRAEFREGSSIYKKNARIIQDGGQMYLIIVKLFKL